MPTPIRSGRSKLIPDLWEGSCTATESCLHQLAPYIGRMKSSMVRALIETYSRPGDLLLDPFVGSGTTAVEALATGRSILCCDSSPYAQVLTDAKIRPPKTIGIAIKRAEEAMLAAANRPKAKRRTPKWVRSFFHPKTFDEILTLTEVLQERGDSFTLACLLGILHHQRPGFLSYPSSHLVPYLRNNRYPKEEYPELYQYREIRPRLIAKIHRAYRRFPNVPKSATSKLFRTEFSALALKPRSVDAVITSPPYMNALDYARDNRLRLWFLGVDETEIIDSKVRNREQYLNLMFNFLAATRNCLKPKGYGVIVIGDVNRSKHRVNLGEIVKDIAVVEVKGFSLEDVIVDAVPDVRRSRRNCRQTKEEWIIVLKRDD